MFLCLEFIHAMHLLLPTNILIPDFDLPCSRRSAAFADLHRFLQQPFAFLWIYFMGINKGYSAALLSVLTISRENNTHINIEYRMKNLSLNCQSSNGFLYQSSACLNLSHYPDEDVRKAHFPCWSELMNICWMDNISESLPGWCNIIFQLERGFYESVSNLMSTRRIYVSVINCSYPNAILSAEITWDPWWDSDRYGRLKEKSSLLSGKNPMGLILICLKSTDYWFQTIWWPCKLSLGP